jgi:hypothetical protein
LPPSKPEFEDHEDPIDYLGFGIVSYFNLLKICIFTFLVITVLHIPVMKIYGSYNNYNEDANDRLFKVVSLGNMGFSTTKCSSSGLAADKIILSCKTGVINKIFDSNAYYVNKLRRDLEN